VLVFYEDLRKKWGSWQGLDGAIYLHRSACGELPSAYEEMSDEAKAGLYAAFDLTAFREWTLDCTSLYFPFPSIITDPFHSISDQEKQRVTSPEIANFSLLPLVCGRDLLAFLKKANELKDTLMPAVRAMFQDDDVQDSLANPVFLMVQKVMEQKTAQLAYGVFQSYTGAMAQKLKGPEAKSFVKEVGGIVRELPNCTHNDNSSCATSSSQPSTARASGRATSRCTATSV
jgi:hypothetical protein